MQTILRILEWAGSYRPTLYSEIKDTDEHRLPNTLANKSIRG